MRLIIAGGRDFNSLDLLTERMDFLLKETTEQVVIISGTAAGADRVGEQYAADKGYLVERYPAQWDKFGKSAGYKRNQQMADQADAVVVFWNGKSYGSKHMIDIAKKMGLNLRIVRYTNHKGQIFLDLEERS